MDLRPYIKTPEQLEEGIEFIRNGTLFYQPYILADAVEVGEGQNLHDNYVNVTRITDDNVYAPGHDVGDRRPPQSLPYFRERNQEYRDIYKYVADEICRRVGGSISKYTVGEIGCNTGLTLFNMAQRGARKCYGYDWNDYNSFFAWMNGLLGTNVQFKQGVYDNLYHQFKDGVDVGEVDIMINTVFTNHQCDPLQFLAYLCDRARKGVFLWALIDSGQQNPTVSYTVNIAGDILPKDRGFPLSFYNGIVISEPLLKISLKYLGFAEVEPVKKFVPAPAWDRFQEGFRMYYAKRTSDAKSAYWGNRMVPQGSGEVAPPAEVKETSGFWKRKKA